MVFTAVVASDLKARAFFYSELAKFAKAGFGMDKACESIIGQSGSDRVARALSTGMLEGVRAGGTLAEGLSRSRYPVSELEVSLVDAAEKGGNLEVGFRNLAEHFRQESEARRRIRRALVYPVFLLHFALLVGIGITAMFQTLGAGLTGHGSGDWRDSVVPALGWVVAGYAATVVLVILWRTMSRLAERSAVMDRWMRRVPLAGPVRRARALARFCEVFHLYLLSGQRMDLAWSRSGDASQSGSIRAHARSASKRLRAGESVGEVVISAGGVFPGDLIRGLASADLAGALDVETAHWARQFREQSAENVERLAVWAPKIFYWLVLGIVAWMILRVAFSYFDIIQGMLDFGG